jgi:hypothetical protein
MRVIYLIEDHRYNSYREIQQSFFVLKQMMAFGNIYFRASIKQLDPFDELL